MVSLGDVHATVDCTVPRDSSAIGYRFVGTGGKLDVSLDDGEWRYWRLEEGAHVPAEMAGIDELWTWNEDYEKGFHNAVRHACRRLDGDDRTVCDGRDAIASLEALVGVFISHYTGSRVLLPLERPFESVEIRSW